MMKPCGRRPAVRCALAKAADPAAREPSRPRGAIMSKTMQWLLAGAVVPAFALGLGTVTKAADRASIVVAQQQDKDTPEKGKPGHKGPATPGKGNAQQGKPPAHPAARQPGQAHPNAAQKPAPAHPKAVQQPAPAHPKAAQQPVPTHPKAAQQPAPTTQPGAHPPNQLPHPAARTPAVPPQHPAARTPAGTPQHPTAQTPAVTPPHPTARQPSAVPPPAAQRQPGPHPSAQQAPAAAPSTAQKPAAVPPAAAVKPQPGQLPHPTAQQAPLPGAAAPARPVARDRQQVLEQAKRAEEWRSRRVQDLHNQRQQVTEGNRTIIREPDRTIIRENGREIIRHNEIARFSFKARDVEVQQRGRDTVTTIVRPGGVRIVTVVDVNGRLLRRVRRDPGGREIIIIDNRVRDPRRAHEYYVDLPPPVIRIPRERYIVEAEHANEAAIYAALIAPPVEPIAQRYSLDEVRFSPMLRD